MIRYTLLILTILLISSCTKPLEYKYQDKKAVADCSGLDVDLANEAYFSFREDLAVYHVNLRIGFRDPDYAESIGYYIYNGASGNGEYLKIASPHTIKIMNLLKKETQLWDTSNGKSNLNYNSEFIKCLIDNIQNPEVKQSIESLVIANSMSPQIFNETYRANIYDSFKDPYFAMLVSFDAYYQFLYNYDLKEE